MDIILSNRSGEPIYSQIEQQIKAAILSGQLQEGDMLPSIRQLARDLKISVITTARAYQDLEREGFVANVQGKGCYVQPQNTLLIREQQLRAIEEHLRAAMEKADMLKLSHEELHRMLTMLKEEL